MANEDGGSICIKNNEGRMEKGKVGDEVKSNSDKQLTIILPMESDLEPCTQMSRLHDSFCGLIPILS